MAMELKTQASRPAHVFRLFGHKNYPKLFEGNDYHSHVGF